MANEEHVAILEQTALIYLDFQVDVCARGGKMLRQEREILDRFEHVRQNAAALLAKVRTSKMAPFIVHVAHTFEPEYPELNGARLSQMDKWVMESNAFIKGSPGAKIVEELKPAPGEYLLQKHSLSPFATTELSWLLTKRRITTVILAGVVTHYAILATALSAFDLGYSVSVLTDCCTSVYQDQHDGALRILAPITTQFQSTDMMNLL